jgi:type IX secretion system PorP/SprF family membrane protein
VTKKLLTYLSFFCVWAPVALFAQDIHFSQYYFSPLSLNPANTGNYKGDFRLFGNYRSQWRNLDKGYDTYSAGGDMNFFPRNINWSGGLFFLSDRSAGSLAVTKIMPSFATHLKVAGFKIHLGVQPGYVIKTIDFNKHTFPNQLNWNTGYFDNNLPNYETNVGQKFSYFDLNAGLIVSRKLGKLEGEMGFAMFHLTRPVETFLKDKSNRLDMRQAYNISIAYGVTRYVVLRAHSLCGYTSKVSDWVSGLNIEYVLNHDPFFTNSVFIGYMWRDGLKRNFDASIVTAGLNYSNYTIGFSYDITSSQLKTSVDSRGAYEIALLYRAKSTRLSKKVIPCDRF